MAALSSIRLEHSILMAPTMSSTGSRSILRLASTRPQCASAMEWHWQEVLQHPHARGLLIFLLAVALCSPPYCLGLGIWHNSRAAADSRFLGSSVGTTYCGDDTDEPLHFEAHHAIEGAGLSVSTAVVMTTSTR